jgi:hypothetical protein
MWLLDTSNNGSGSMKLLVTVHGEKIHIHDVTMHVDNTISGYLEDGKPIFLRQYDYYVVE